MKYFKLFWSVLIKIYFYGYFVDVFLKKQNNQLQEYILSLAEILLKYGFMVLVQIWKNILLIIIFLLIVINIFMVLYIKNISGKNFSEKKSYVSEEDRKIQKTLYKSIEDSLLKQREFSHDYKNHIVCIHVMLEQGKYDKAKEYLKNISGIISQDLYKIDTNHPIVNAVINVKYQEAVEKDIMVICKVNDLSGITIRDPDIVLILSNIFNNAIEACEKCTGKRVLKFKFVIEKGNLIMSIQNSYNGIIIKKGKSLQTTKNNENGVHGIGLNSIIRTVEKYNGLYNIFYDSCEFHLFIDIPQINL